jgi:hypothetical protein
MPVTIHPALLAPSRKQPGPRRRHFDQAVRKLAPAIAEIRNEGSRGVKEIMDALNARGVAAPNGKVFTFGTTHRVLRRLYQLGLGPKAPNSVQGAVGAALQTASGWSEAEPWPDAGGQIGCSRIRARVSRHGSKDLSMSLASPGAAFLELARFCGPEPHLDSQKSCDLLTLPLSCAASRKKLRPALPCWLPPTRGKNSGSSSW